MVSPRNSECIIIALVALIIGFIAGVYVALEHECTQGNVTMTCPKD